MYSVPEEAKPGTTVGNLAKDFSLNLDDLERRGFRIVSGQNERYFDLNRKTGTLHIKDRIDREELCGRSLKLKMCGGTGGHCEFSVEYVPF